MNPITTLRLSGFDYGVQAALLGLNPVTLRRWEERETSEIPAYPRTMLSAFVVALDARPELKDTIPLELVSRGAIHCLYTLLGASLSTADT